MTPDSAGAEGLNEQGRWLLQEAELDAAKRAFLAAVDLDPSSSSAWFNLGLVHKVRHEWADALRCNLRSAELSHASTEDPAWWNLGIAATALRDWDVARRAWTRYGIVLPSGAGPIDGDFGRACVRISPQVAPEVIWCRRLDPARGRIDSVPLVDSGHRWGDIVLHDGAPNGQRVVDGRTYPVFDELERWEPSSTPTQRVAATCASRADATALVEAFEHAHLAAEDWTGSVEMLCKACSEGTPDPLHRHHARDAWARDREFGVAADVEQAGKLLAAWAGVAPTRRVVLQIDPGV